MSDPVPGRHDDRPELFIGLPRVFPDGPDVRHQASTTIRRHDNGLGSNIGYGRVRDRLDVVEVFQQGAAKINDSQGRCTADLITHVTRICSQLDLPDRSSDRAVAIVRDAYDAREWSGNTLERIAASAVLLACQDLSIPVTASMIADLSPATDEISLWRCKRRVADAIDLSVKPRTPLDYLPRLISDLDLDAEHEQGARELVLRAQDAGIHSGRKPIGVAAAAVWMQTPQFVYPTQKEVAEVADICTYTIRDNVSLIEDLDGDQHE